jgi:hypothetical protein
MFKFLFGVLMGAGGYWFYRFWKGEDDTSWDQPFSTPEASSYQSYSSTPSSGSTTGAGSGTGSSSTSGASSTASSTEGAGS